MKDKIVGVMVQHLVTPTSPILKLTHRQEVYRDDEIGI